LEIGFVDERSAHSLSQGGFGRRARAQVHVKVISMSKLIWNNNDGESLRRTKKWWLLINVGLSPLHFLDQRIDPTFSRDLLLGVEKVGPCTGAYRGKSKYKYWDASITE
jgi:hypothetical protein